MKRIIILFFILLNSYNFSLCQKLSNYTGNYKGGMATYSFIEDENQARIYQGPFKFTKNISYEHFRNVQITGEYKKNLKTGLWKYMGNDDSSKAVALYARGIADAIIEGRNNRSNEVVKAVKPEGVDEFVEVEEAPAA